MSELLQCQNYFSTRTTKIIARQYVLHEKGPGGFLGLTWVLKKNTNSAVSEILYTWTVSVNSDTAEESTSYSGAYWSYWSRLQGRLGYAVQWTFEFPLNSSCTHCTVVYQKMSLYSFNVLFETEVIYFNFFILIFLF